MHCVLHFAILASTVSALLVRDDKCYFGLKGNDGKTVGQLPDGQNRFGNNLPPASYSLSNSGITDSSGRGCILTPPTTQLQCDSGAPPTTGFGISCNGTVTYNGNQGDFYECATGDGGMNIYSHPPADDESCFMFVLSATNCVPQCESPSPAPPPPPPSLPSNCPANLKGSYQFPHLIVPVDHNRPDQALGTSYDGVIVANEDSLFLFDIPAGYSGKTCSLVFLLPKKEDLRTSSYELSGSGAIDFAQLKSNINKGTTWNNKGDVAKDFGITTVAPGSSSVITTFPCPAGQQISYQLSSSGGTSLTYFQDYNPEPIGLYITSC